MKIVLTYKKIYLFIIFIALSYFIFMPNVYAGDSSLLTNTNNPNVLIFLDTSGSMNLNEGVHWDNTSSGKTGYDSPEGWAGGNLLNITTASPFPTFTFAPGGNSVFSMLYNAKAAISDIVGDPSFSNVNFAFATFDQEPYIPIMGPIRNIMASLTPECTYTDDPTFTNPPTALYNPENFGGDGIPDETGDFYTNFNILGVSIPALNLNYPFMTFTTLDLESLGLPVNGCPNSFDLIPFIGPKEYLMSYDYSSIYNQFFSLFGLINLPWNLYVPTTTDNNLNILTNETVTSNPNNTDDPYFDPADIAGPAINYVLWKAHIYPDLDNPAGNPVSGLKAGGLNVMNQMVGHMQSYFRNSLIADSGASCRRNYSIIITNGSFTGFNGGQTPSKIYQLYKDIDPAHPIETFMIGFGYPSGLLAPNYIQLAANAGAGINPSTNPNGIIFSATLNNSKLLVLPSAAFASIGGVLLGDTVSDNKYTSLECEANNYTGVYTDGSDCATIVGIYPNSQEILLSNSLASSFNGGNVTVSGTVYLPYNQLELRNSLGKIFNLIESGTVASFTSPVIHDVYGSNNDVYYSNLTAYTQPLWGEGNIFLFKLNNQGQLIGRDGSAVNSYGQIITSDSYWDSGAGAGGELQTESGSHRKVLTSYISQSTGGQQSIDINPVSTSSSNANLDTMLDINSNSSSQNYYGTVCPGSASAAACATDILNFVLDPDSSTDHWKLGAIFHSDPVLVGPPPFPYTSPSYISFKQLYAERNQVLLVGANDGMLHGFDAGSWDSLTDSYTNGTGAELFGYIPPNLLPKITDWYDSSIGIRTLIFPEFVDSTPAVGDVYFNDVFNGQVNHINTATNPDSIDQWHTELISGERNGGNYYFALGVTNPSDLNNPNNPYPDPLWNITDGSSTAPMGNTWSKPVISYVCMPNPYYSSKSKNSEAGVCQNDANPAPPLLVPQYVKTYLGFIGGGYAAEGSTDDTGAAVYALYAEPNPVKNNSGGYTDNQILWKFDSSNDSNMTFPIPSAISPVLSQNFRMEAFYAGDLGGQMWAFNLPDDSSASNWKGCRLFDSNETDPALNIYFPPTLSYAASGNLWVYFGTGDRENLTASNARDNEFIAINTGLTAVGECPSGGPLNESDLVNATGTSGIGTVSGNGWYIKLSTGEKVVSSPVVYNNIVYFTTFTPQGGSSCGYGTAKLYAVYYLDGGGMISTSVSISNSSASSSNGQSITIGGGVPSAPEISGNNLIVTTSTGKVFTKKIPGSPQIIPTSWFHTRN
jgi:type IV pilus assembly protein PilY1